MAQLHSKYAPVIAHSARAAIKANAAALRVLILVAGRCLEWLGAIVVDLGDEYGSTQNLERYALLSL